MGILWTAFDRFEKIESENSKSKSQLKKLAQSNGSRKKHYHSLYFIMSSIRFLEKWTFFKCYEFNQIENVLQNKKSGIYQTMTMMKVTMYKEECSLKSE